MGKGLGVCSKGVSEDNLRHGEKNPTASNLPPISESPK